MSTSLVTGGAGFLGSHLCDHLLDKGNRVICVDNLDTGSLQNIEHIRAPEFTFLNHDLTEPLELDTHVDRVYHLASPASPIDYQRLPLHTLKVGSYGTHHMLGLAKLKRARFLLASTSEVYGDPEVHPQSEDYWGNVNPIGPRGVYDEAKRYAEALTMAYHSQQGVDTCMARIFNSILADEQVLFDDGRELRRETAAELAARLATYALVSGHAAPAGSVAPNVSGPGTSLAEIAPAMEFPLQGYTVPAFDAEGRVISADASSFIGHPTAQRCYRVSTRYGRSIRVTGDHSVFVQGPTGEPVARPVTDLEPGDRIAIARRIEVPERDRRNVNMIEVWRHAEEDPWDLYAEAGGLGRLAWERRQDIFGLLASQRRNNGPSWRNGAWTKIIRMRDTDRVPLPCLWRIGKGVPEGARVRMRVAGRTSPMPLQVEITDELLWLLGLWVAEGTACEGPGNSFISISCEEDVLGRATNIIERGLGLHVVQSPGDASRGPAIFVHSKLLLRLFEFLGLGRNRKRIPGWVLGLPLSRLKWFIEGYREGDGVHSGKTFDARKRHEFSTTHEELKDDLIVALARFGLLPSVGRYETTFRKRTGDRRYPFWRLTIPDCSPWSPLEWDGGVEQRLQARSRGDLVWAVVREIEEIPSTELVFDFSVPGFENFWAGSGVMAHNTYGARMRPHDGRAIPTFLRQALQDKPVTVFGEGSQTRSFCYVQDMVRGLVALMESGVHLPVNLGNPVELSLLELAKAVIEVTESRSEIVFEALPIDDPRVRQPDITRASQLLGWEPKVELRDGLRQTIEQAGVERLVGAPE